MNYLIYVFNKLRGENNMACQDFKKVEVALHRHNEILHRLERQVYALQVGFIALVSTLTVLCLLGSVGAI